MHALLINGGDKPESNYLSHLHHLEDMVELLGRRGVAAERIHIFSADGQDESADLATRDAPPPDFWLIEGTGLGNRLRPHSELTNTRWAGVTLHPAKLIALRDWFEKARKEIGPQDQLLVFVTDHGTSDRKDPANAAISLWREKLTVSEFKTLLAPLVPGIRVVFVMSQCYSGAFADLMYDTGSSQASGNVCGFFSTKPELKAYGCYPEGRDRDRMGHAFQFIDALSREATTGAAHLEVLVADDTPDVPLRSSDVYLARLVSEEATARGMEGDSLADSLLAEAWRNRAQWEPEIRLLDRIGEAFATFSPRSLRELSAREKELGGLAGQMKTYSDRWKTAFVELKESALRTFLKERSDWQAYLNRFGSRALSSDERAEALTNLLPVVMDHARGRPQIWQRLETLRDYATRGSEGTWRLEVRKAALQRMRAILVGIAGRVLIARDGGDRRRNEPGRFAGQQQSLERLEACEDLAPPKPPDLGRAAQSRRPEPFPPLSSEIELLKEILPSWLGVRFKSLPDSVRAARRLPAGANLLEAVYPGSPAEEAGLRAGDIILGQPGQPFDLAQELREWTMTAPRDTPLTLLALRPGNDAEEDSELEVMVELGPYPVDLPQLREPPRVGDRGPTLPDGLKPVRSTESVDLEGRPHLLFFWATWCGPCKRAVPEVMAFAAARGLPALAISDEEAGTVAKFLESWQEPFFDSVTADPLRKTFISYGVSGTPTIIVVDAKGVIRHRQVGYSLERGLTVEGWKWSAR